MFKSIDRNTLIAGSFFFCVLYALFVMRPFRSAMAAQIGTSDLTYDFFDCCLSDAAGKPYLFLSCLKGERIKTCNLYLWVLYYQLIFIRGINNLYPDNYAVGVRFLYLV